MKSLGTIIRIIAFAGLGLQLQCRAQPKPEPTTITLDQAEAFINQAEAKAFRSEFAASALRIRRLDLIELCFSNQYTYDHLYEAARNLTDERFKAQVVLLMLKSSSSFWPPDEYQNGFFAKRPFDEPVKSVVATYLPKERLDTNLVATRTSRLALADKLVNVLAAENEVPKTSKPEPLPQGAKQTIPAPQPSPATPNPTVNPPASPSRAVSVAETPSALTEHRVPVWPWIIGIAGLAVVALFALNRRAK